MAKSPGACGNRGSVFEIEGYRFNKASTFRSKKTKSNGVIQSTPRKLQPLLRLL
jgi:hypothetical protein